MDQFSPSGQTENQEVDPKSVTISQWATYCDTGIWSIENGMLFAPKNLTIRQLRDQLLVSGGAIYLHKSGRFVWIPSSR
jgi:hypothetical protein